MIRRMVTAVLSKRATAFNEWKESVATWHDEPQGVEIAISTSTGAIESTNNVLSIKSTHVGVTRDERVEAGDRLTVGGHVYNVEYVMTGRANRQAFLSECDEI